MVDRVRTMTAGAALASSDEVVGGAEVLGGAEAQAMGGSHDETAVRIAAVKPPRPVLDRRRERQLTDRQRELLDALGSMFEEGFAHLTMAELASRLNCSLRTLYALAGSRDELVLIVVDRNLWRVGRTARAAIRPGMEPLDAIKAYLHAATVAVSGWTEAFARDLAAVAAVRAVSGGHDEYLFDVTRTLLDLAVDRGDIAAVDTSAMARVMSGLGSAFTNPAVMPTLGSPPKDAADAVVDVMLIGLRATTPAASAASRASAVPGAPVAPAARRGRVAGRHVPGRSSSRTEAR